MSKRLALVIVLFCLPLGCSYVVGTTTKAAYQVATDERSPEVFAEDAVIVKSIQARLATHEDIDVRSEILNISVCVHRGRAVLVGELHSPAAARKAVETARQTQGVTWAEGYFLPRRDGPLLSDTTIAAKVRSLFIGDSTLKGFQVDISVVQGHVVLAGVVSSMDQEMRCVDLAGQIEGVERVVDFIQIR
jgi:osmotically-inducible protein OsmY